MVQLSQSPSSVTSDQLSVASDQELIVGCIDFCIEPSVPVTVHCELLPNFFPIPPRKIYLTTVGSKSSSLRNAMNACPCCSAQLLRHVRYKSIYWFCSRCRQEMPAIDSLRTNLYPKLQTSKSRNQIFLYQKVLLTTPKIKY